MTSERSLSILLTITSRVALSMKILHMLSNCSVSLNDQWVEVDKLSLYRITCLRFTTQFSAEESFKWQCKCSFNKRVRYQLRLRLMLRAIRPCIWRLTAQCGHRVTTR